MTVTSHIHIGLAAWSSATYSLGARRTNGGNAYQCITAGSSTAAPTGTGASINNGGVAVWRWLSAINYTSIQAWADAWPSTLIDDLVGLIWNDALITATAGVSILLSPAVTNAGHSITLKPAPGESFRDKGANTALSFSQANGVAIQFPASPGNCNYFDNSTANFTIDGIQIKDPLSTSDSTFIQTWSGASNFHLRGCLLDGYSQVAGASILGLSDTATIEDCLIVDRQAVNSNGIPIVTDSAAVFINNTTVAINSQNTVAPVLSNGTVVGSVIVRNHVSTGYELGVAASPNMAGSAIVDYSATDQALIVDPAYSAADGGNNLTSQSASSIFVNVATDFRLKAGSALIGAGVVDTTDCPTGDDIFRIARGAAWDIGASEHQTTAVWQGAASIAGSAAVSPTQTARRVATGTIATAGGVAAAATLMPASNLVFGAVGIAAATGASASGLVVARASGNFAGVGLLTAKGTALQTSATTLAGVGLAATTGVTLLPSAITRAAQTGFVASASIEKPAIIAVGATLSLSVKTSVVASQLFAVVDPDVVGTLTAQALVRNIVRASIQGSATTQLGSGLSVRRRASAAIGGRVSLSSIATGGVGHAFWQASTLVGANPFSADFSADFGYISPFSSEFDTEFLDQRVPSIHGVGRLIADASVVVRQFALVGHGAIAVSARVVARGVAAVSGAVGVRVAATQSVPQALTDPNVVTTVLARTVARLQGRARLPAAVVFSAGSHQAVGSDIEVPTEVEFDALAARVAALEGAGPQLALYAAKTFYVVEIEAARAPTSVITPTKGYGTRPFGSSARRTRIATSTTSILASDLGYRSKATDQIGVQSYPPLVSEAFQIDRRVNLDPTASQIGAAWGSISLSNAGRAWDGLAASWDNDGRDVRILSGFKTYDASRGYFTDPGYAELRAVFVGLSRQWNLTDTSLEVPLIDAAYWLDRSYQTTTYGGGGRYDGTADLAGVPFPRARGGIPSAPIPNVTPTLIDPVNRIYQYSDAPGEVMRLREGGATPFGFAGDTTDLYAGTTPSGFYRTDDSRALFQLGAMPVGQITADVMGSFPNSGPVSTAADLVYLMMIEDMALPDIYVDADSFAIRAPLPFVSKGFATDPRGTIARRTTILRGREPASAPAGVYFSSQDRVTGLQAVEAVLGSFGGQIIPTRSGVLRLVLLRALAPSARAVATYDPSTLISLTRNNLPGNLSPMPFRFRVGYAHNYTVQTTGVSVSATPEQTQFAAAADRFATWISPGIQAALRRPSDPNPVGGALLLSGDAQSVANRLGALWGVRRRSYTAVLPSVAGLAREIGDVVSLRYPMDDLSSGRLGQIIGEQFDSMAGSISHQLLV